MPDERRRSCRCCGKSEAEVGSISWTGNCIECAKVLLAENITGIATRTGYAHRRRLRGIAKYLDRALLDAGQARS